MVNELPRPRFCYLEIPALDVEQSASFYESLFGWNIRQRGSGRPSFVDATGNVSGAWVAGRSPVPEPGLLPYVWVDNIDDTLGRAAMLGGQVLARPHRDHEPDGEWIATFRDPAGNVIGLYQEGPR
jgi:predicted enzyme related to lactoylglutathione lyase